MFYIYNNLCINIIGIVVIFYCLLLRGFLDMIDLRGKIFLNESNVRLEVRV